MQKIHDFDYTPLEFDRQGALSQPAQFSGLQSFVTGQGVTDVLFIAHGWRNDANDATSLYTGFLKTFRDNIGRDELKAAFAGRKFAVAGVMWPSKSFSEGTSDEGAVAGIVQEEDLLNDARARLEELKSECDSVAARASLDEAIALLPSLAGDEDAQDAFVDHVLSIVAKAEFDPTEGLDRVRTLAGHELLQKLAFPVILPTGDEPQEGGAAGVGDIPIVDGDGGAAGLGSFLSGIGGKVGKLLNFTTWYVMKDRAGIVGANGMQQAVRGIHAAAPGARIHLAGHSLGARLVTACAKSLATDPRVPINTLSLLQGAFSHYGFSANNGFGAPGFFRAVVERGVVDGPIIATHSSRDSVVGYAYAISARAAGDNAKAVGDSSDQYGGIGRNGAQRTAECLQHTLGTPGAAYQFTSGMVNNLNGDRIITGHSDIERAEVSYAVAVAMSQA